MDTSVSSTACSVAASTHAAAAYMYQLNSLMSTLASVHPERARRGFGAPSGGGVGPGVGGAGVGSGPGASGGELVVGRVTGADIEEAVCAGAGWRELELPRDALPLFGLTRTCTCGSSDTHSVQGEPGFRYYYGLYSGPSLASFQLRTLMHRQMANISFIRHSN